MFHASVRINARVRGDSGAVAGLFTFYNSSQESDIEILTKGNLSTVYYTNHPNTDANGHTISAAGTQSTLPNHGVGSDWNVHRLDWVTGLSRWFVNGDFVANKTYGVPTVPSTIIMNIVSCLVSIISLFSCTDIFVVE